MEPASDSTERHAARLERRRLRRLRTRRFLERYERRRLERIARREHRLVRPVRILAGILLIVAGVAVGWLPGPGFIILALPGAFLLASEVRRAAVLMDRIENEAVPRVHRLRARLRGGPRSAWVERDPAGWQEWCERTGCHLPPTAPGDDDDRQPLRAGREPEPM